MEERQTTFANAVLGDWEESIGQFFMRVERKREVRGLTPENVQSALWLGYGAVVGDAWGEWAEVS